MKKKGKKKASRILRGLLISSGEDYFVESAAEESVAAESAAIEAALEIESAWAAAIESAIAFSFEAFCSELSPHATNPKIPAANNTNNTFFIFYNKILKRNKGKINIFNTSSFFIK